MTIFYAFIVAFFASLLLIPPLTRLAYHRRVVDQPDGRKVHEASIPRIGGLAIFLAFLFASFLFVEIDSTLRGIFLGIFMILGIGLVDDLQGLSPYQKLVGQFIAAGFPVFFSGIRIESLGVFSGMELLLPPWLSIAFTLLVIVAVTNAINLSDGLDGLAGGIAMITTVGLGLLAWQAYGANQEIPFYILLVALAGSILGFLKFNTHPATIFMGDTGSLFLGFSSITLCLYLIHKSGGRIGPAHAVLIFAVPIIDTLWVMGNRLARGVSPFTADRNHLHHKLMDMGLSHKAVVTLIYGLTTASAIVPVIFFHSSSIVLYGIFAIIVAAALPLLYVLAISGFKVTSRRTKRALNRYLSLRLIVRLRSKALVVMKYIIITILILPAFFLPAIPKEFGIVAIGFACLLIFLLLWERRWADDFLYFAIYFASAVILLVNNFYPLEYNYGGGVYYLQPLYNGIFMVLAGLVAFEIFLARRTEVLLSTPLEFFILVIALAVPLLPQELIGSYKLGAVGIKSITLFLGYKVLLMKTVKKNRRTIVALIASSLIIGGRALTGW